MTLSLDRRDLQRAFPGDRELIKKFEELRDLLDSNTGDLSGIKVTIEGHDTDLQTLLTVVDELQPATDTVKALAALPNNSGAIERLPDGSFNIRIIGGGDGAGLVTRDGTETLAGKTLNAPKLSGLGNYANDAAAATGGVPIGGIYRNGSVVQVRVS